MLEDLSYPHDDTAERAILGAMIKDPESIPLVLESLREEDFYVEDHRLLFSVLSKIWEEKGKDWDDIVLREYLRKAGLLERLSMDLVYQLAEEAAEGALLEEAVRIVKEKSGLRQLLELSLNTIKEIKEEPDFARIVEAITQRVYEISEKHTTTQYFHIKDVVREVLEIINRRKREDRIITGLPTGFMELDLMTTGFHPSDLVIVAARPGMGKSSFMLSIALHIAVEERVPVVIYSLEMTKEQLVLRLLSMTSGVPLQNLRKGFVGEEEDRKLMAAALELAKADIIIDDTPNLSTVDLRIRSRKLKKERNVGAVFVDYLQLLRPPHRRSSRQEEVAEISRNLKALAKELELPVIALAQLSRQVEHRSDKRPQLADLRESGQIEQDADLILFIHRPEYYKKNPSPEEQGIAEIIVAKQRQGPTGIVKVAFIKDTTAFKPIASGIPTSVEPYQPEEEFSEEDYDLDF
ncbi:replicative DNA helicase [Thermocrinis albus DSM 14484]|uniref:Replicative DNA helicase n=1 Tax=Thermocrinis albus (strain DSM 14484 / JCM 11386 / HI 11/12) TaxID=638303 RepID=D3SL10_THEAH|nr:replicative DNA helicase [Thermocrinis albus]ADC89440.1 replicative DNA helicase [Thermocrinis albus DSM 14484]